MTTAFQRSAFQNNAFQIDVAEGAGSGVQRLWKSELSSYWLPEPKRSGVFGEGIVYPAPIVKKHEGERVIPAPDAPKTDAGIVPSKPDKAPEPAPVVRAARTDAKALTEVERRLERVAELQARKRKLDAMREEMKIQALQRQIEAEDELLIVALLAA